MPQRAVTILGAGLVGSLLAVIMRKRNHEVTVYERRPDMRRETIAAGRSINMAMSERGWKALELAGLREELEPVAIPMYGRYLHQEDGTAAFQAYGKNKEAIYSISRGGLNKMLMNAAERVGAQLYFGNRCQKVQVGDNMLEFEDGATQQADLLFGADGAHSALRSSYVYLDRVNASQHYLEHGYKELSIPATPDGGWLIEKNALHIWPRHNYMLIALPNTDGSFTCTLFFPFEGKDSFEALQTPDDVTAFFQKNFPDALPLLPTLTEDFFNNPTSSLITTHIAPWHYGDKSALIGDAAHAIVPFYGQGMNAGFEDITVLCELMDQHGGDWTTILAAYDKARRPNGDAVAELALHNFIEMRDLVADPVFLERKKIEKELGRRFPDKFISVYEMVSFTHLPYDYALRCMNAQDVLLGKIMGEGNFELNSKDMAFNRKLEGWLDAYAKATAL